MINPILGGAAIGAIGNLIGGFMGQDSARSANQQNAIIAQRNLEQQERFAKSGIQWRVADAKKAGISPLAALGAAGASYQPVGGYVEPDNSIGNALSNTGQDISRAVAATETEFSRRLGQLNLSNAELDLEGKMIDNQIRLSQLRKMTSVGPAFPSASDNFIPGQGNSGLVIDEPLKRTVSAPGRPAQEAGWRPDVSYSRTDTGLTPMVPTSLSESLEDDIIGKMMWRWRNQMLPNVSGQGKPPLSMLPKGYSDWDWSGWKQEWQPVKSKGSYPVDRWFKSGFGGAAFPR